MRPAPLVALLLVAAGLAGCASPPDARASLVPYPKLGAVATYEAMGAYVEFARWENGHPFASPTARVQYALAANEKMLDGARQSHPAFKVTTSIAEVGPFVRHAELYVSPEHQAIVQSYYPLSQDQSIVAFDERGLPWLFGASALFGQDISEGARAPFAIPDNFGQGLDAAFVWRVDGREAVGGVDAVRLHLDGHPSLTGALWMEPGSAWPLRAQLTLHDDALAPIVRADAAYPVTIDARRVALTPGDGDLPARKSGATFAPDDTVTRVEWDGEKPPDGAAGYVPYLLADAVRDAKVLDRGLAEWLVAAQDPRLYRATHKDDPNPINGTPPLQGTRAPYWLLQFVDKEEKYYEVQVERLDVVALGTGAPRVLKSGPVDAPKSGNHGWFPKESLPAKLVPLSEGARVAQQVFGAGQIQVFLRSFVEPPGYSYFLDGGWEGGERGRYTVVYNPATGFIEEATGPVTPRAAP